MKSYGVGGQRFLHRNLVYPAVVAARGEWSLYAVLADLRSLQWRSADELRDRQARKLFDLLSYAASRSEFYEGRWAHSEVRLETVFDDVRRLPLLTKSDLQRSHSRLLARPGPRRLTRKVTGGSTGEPVTLVKDRAATAAERAVSWLGYGWFGVRPGDRAARFWGSPRTTQRRLAYWAADVAMNRTLFSAFAFDEADLHRYWERCQRLRPDYLYGYVSMLEAMARVGAAANHRPWPELKVAITTAEVLSTPQREVIGAAFGAPVQNEYGCGEVGAIAYECPAGSMHLMTENHYVELLRPDGTAAEAGETGEIVVTDLVNRAMPLIRYRVGDLGVMREGACSCGRGFPSLERVWGREYDQVTTPDGRSYHGEFFMYLFEDLRSRGLQFEQFQVVQTSADHLDVRVIAASPADDVLESIRSELHGRLPRMQSTVRAVAEIPRKSSGKFSVVENPWQRSTRNEGERP